MPCYLVYKSFVRRLLKNRITDRQAEEILRGIEREVGHDVNLIKAVIDAEGAGLARRLRKMGGEPVRKKKAVAVGYA